MSMLCVYFSDDESHVLHQGRNFDDTDEELETGDDLQEYENCPDVMMYVRGERSVSEVTDTSID